MLDGNIDHVQTIKGLKLQIVAANKLEKTYKLIVKNSEAKVASSEKDLKQSEAKLADADKKKAAAVKECASQYKTSILELKAEHNARVTELRADHKRDLAREEARGKKNLEELEEKRKADVKEIKDKCAENLKEKAAEIVALKKQLLDVGRARTKEVAEIQKFERAAEYSRIRAKHSVDVHANKQVINEMVRQKHQDDIRERRSSMMSNMGGAGFCSMMERPNMLVMDRDVQLIMASSIHRGQDSGTRRGGGQQSWYSGASARYSGALSRHHDNHSTSHRSRHHDNGGSTISSYRSRHHEDNHASSGHPNCHHDDHASSSRWENQSRRSGGVPSNVSIKQSGYRGDDCSDGLELENMTMNRGDF
jgi:hypothetical protein